jgi:fumarate reductase flavoprotein subunit
MDLQRDTTDVLIVGAGGAGLFAALHALQADPDLAVTVAVKGLLGKCGCTRMVQGGYNVALAPDDSLERHFMDTIVGGKWLPRQDLAWRLVEGAVERIQELENELGCFFDRNPDGSLHQKAFAGQSFDRTVHKGDLTGIEIMNRLMEQVWSVGARRLEEHRAIALIPSRDGAAIAGALFIDMRTGGYRFGQGGPAGGRRRADHVPLPHAVGRQVLRRHGHGLAAWAAAPGHGDGAVPPHWPARRSGDAHDRHRA